jgi:uncharacterized protein (TIRG00374 family)
VAGLSGKVAEGTEIPARPRGPRPAVGESSPSSSPLAGLRMSFLASRRLLPLQIALWVLPLGAVVWWASTQSAPELPSTLSGGMELVGALAVYALATLARAERWHAILVAEAIPAKRADTYALVPVGYMGNNVLPARAGELLRVFLLGARTRGGRRTILGSVLVERILDAMALALLLVVLAFGLAKRLRIPHSPPVLIAVAAIILLGVVAGAVVARKAHLRERFTTFVLPMLRPARQLVSWRGGVLLVLSLGIWALEASVYALVGEALDAHIGLHGALSIVAFTNLCALIPAAPGYIGTYDAAVLFALKAVSDVSGGLALSYLILLRFVLFVPITVVGLVILFVRYGGLSRLRAARAQAAA